MSRGWTLMMWNLPSDDLTIVRDNEEKSTKVYFDGKLAWEVRDDDELTFEMRRDSGEVLSEGKKRNWEIPG